MSLPRSSVVSGLVVVVLLLIISAASVYIRPSSTLAVQPTIVQQRLPYEVTLTPSQAPQAGQATTFTLSVKRNGQPDSLLERGVLAHVTVASANGQDMWFYHATNDLVDVGPGLYTFTHTFTQASVYTFWIELNDNTTADHHGAQTDYIGRVDFSLGNNNTPSAAQRLVAKDNAFTLRLEPHSLSVRPVWRLILTVRDATEKAVPVLPQADHYLASVGPDHYELWHFDQAASSEYQLTTDELVFPRPGTYNIFIRAFTNSGTAAAPQIGQELSGVFTLVIP